MLYYIKHIQPYCRRHCIRPGKSLMSVRLTGDLFEVKHSDKLTKGVLKNESVSSSLFRDTGSSGALYKSCGCSAITQPSLSHAISSLEEELGVKLFEKNGRNVSLTKYGKSFLEDVEQTLNRLDSSVNGLQLAGKGEGQIDVAFLRTLGVDFMPKIIRSFLNANKGKQIHFNLFCDKVLTGDILTGLKEKKYDIGFCSKFDDEPLIEFIPVAKQDLVVIVPPEHPLAEKSEIHLEETLPYKQIIFKKRSGLRQIIDQLFKSIGQYPDVAFEIDEDQVPQDLLPMISASALHRISQSFTL